MGCGSLGLSSIGKRLGYHGRLESAVVDWDYLLSVSGWVITGGWSRLW